MYNLCFIQGRSQNLKAVPQNFIKVFKVDDFTINNVIQKKQNLLRKEKLQISHPSCVNIFMAVLQKKVNVGYDIGSISMQIASHIHNAANTSLQRTSAKATSKNVRFPFLENHRVRSELTEKFILAFSTTLA